MANYTFEFRENQTKAEWTMHHSFRTDKLAMFYGCFISDMFDEDPELLMEDPKALDDSFQDYIAELKEVGEYKYMTEEELDTALNQDMGYRSCISITKNGESIFKEW